MLVQLQEGSWGRAGGLPALPRGQGCAGNSALGKEPLHNPALPFGNEPPPWTIRPARSGCDSYAITAALSSTYVFVAAASLRNQRKQSELFYILFFLVIYD